MNGSWSDGLVVLYQAGSDSEKGKSEGAERQIVCELVHFPKTPCNRNLVVPRIASEVLYKYSDEEVNGKQGELLLVTRAGVLLR